MKRILAAGVLLCCLCLAGCTSFSPVAGTESGSQTTNGIVLGLVYSDGHAGANLNAALRPQNYLTSLPQGVQETDGTSRDALTDDKGVLRLDSLNPGVYVVEVNDRKGFAVAVRCTASATGSKTNLGVETLAPTGVIDGSVFLDPNNRAPRFVQVFGLERLAPVDPQTGKFQLSDIPAGNHILRVVSRNADSAPVVFDNVAVPSGSKLALPVSGEYFSRAIYFNTTQSGANVRGNVYKFPVCIRLTKSNFNFTVARADGGDLRFAKKDKTLLPFEIERFDAVNGKAEIWVTVDTVLGNNNTQYIMMYWGNPAATSASRGPHVFDTAHGFQGVWHLSDHDATASITDAVGRNNGILKSGIMETSTSAARQTGITGPACVFSGSNQQWVDLGANKPFVAGRSEITISIWINTIDTIGQPQLFNFSIGGLLDTIPESRVSLGLKGNRIQINARAHDAGTSHFYVDSTIIVPQTWYHVVGVLKIPENFIWLYVNGELSLSTPNIFTGTATDPTPSTHCSIAANDVGSDRFFSGKLDEARIESRGRSPDWIKLSYENQKANDALIVFK